MWIRKHIRRPLLIGPDSESGQWVRQFAALVAAPYRVLDKVRRGDRKVAIRVPALRRFRTHTPVLVDDMISTGRTLAKVVRQLLQQGLPPRVCVATHAVFAGDALRALRNAGAAAVITSDTIAYMSNRVTVASSVARGRELC